MKLGIMQPYFFPYIGYYELIAQTDQFVIFDIVQFMPKSWMSRNRILHPVSSWQYISVPLVHPSRNKNICQTFLHDTSQCCQKILAQVQHYRKHAPYFTSVCTLIKEVFATTLNNSLTSLNTQSIAIVCDYLGIPFKPIICSEAKLAIPPIQQSGQWALEISTLLGATEYINPVGGEELFQPDEFQKRSIKLSFLPLANFEYQCPPYQYETALSIIDVLLWNDPNHIKNYLTSQKKINSPMDV